MFIFVIVSVNNASIDACRNQYEHGVITGRLGLLLSKWDKRDTEAAQLIDQANSILTDLKSKQLQAAVQGNEFGKPSVLLSRLIQLPILYYTVRLLNRVTYLQMLITDFYIGIRHSLSLDFKCG